MLGLGTQFLMFCKKRFCSYYQNPSTCQKLFKSNHLLGRGEADRWNCRTPVKLDQKKTEELLGCYTTCVSGILDQLSSLWRTKNLIWCSGVLCRAVCFTSWWPSWIPNILMKPRAGVPHRSACRWVCDHISLGLSRRL